MAGAVLDASALLAYLRDEPGGDVVADAMAGGAAISAVNLAEVLSRVADHGGDPAALADKMTQRGLLGGAITVVARPAARSRSSRLVPRTHGGQRVGSGQVGADPDDLPRS